MTKKETFYIKGMTCGSCELMIERKLKKVPGILSVQSNCRTGFTVIHVDEQNPPSPEAIEAAVEAAGYSLTEKSQEKLEAEDTVDNKWLEIGAFLVFFLAIYQMLKGLDIFSLSGGAESASTLASTFVIGLVAGTSSCLAVTGGLLLSMAAKYNEVHKTETRWQKFKPLLAFNGGRLISYFLLGGLVGLLGQSIALSTQATGVMNIVIALVMVYLALSILKILPKGVLGIKPPKALSHWIAGLSEHEHPLAPFVLGALTFFLPCGFTQSLQLVALASGSFWEGALTMFVFALGTLPALLGISAISSFTEGRAARLFLRFSGTLVLLLALLNLKSGLALTGFELPSFKSEPVEAVEVEVDADGTQVIRIKANAFSYDPSSFTIEAGKPVRIEVDAAKNVGGCGSVITVPKYDFVEYLTPGQSTTLGTIENPQDDFIITCGMGMISTRVNVVPASEI